MLLAGRARRGGTPAARTAAHCSCSSLAMCWRPQGWWWIARPSVAWGASLVARWAGTPRWQLLRGLCTAAAACALYGVAFGICVLAAAPGGTAEAPAGQRRRVCCCQAQAHMERGALVRSRCRPMHACMPHALHVWRGRACDEASTGKARPTLRGIKAAGRQAGLPPPIAQHLMIQQHLLPC